MSEVLRLERGQTAVFGYGSLMSRASLERTLGDAYEGPFLPCELRGWTRSWSVAMPNGPHYFLQGGQRTYPEAIVYLDARPDPAATMNGILFVVGPPQIEHLDRREWIYARTEVTDDLRGLAVRGGGVVLYRGRAEHRFDHAANPRHAAVRATYLALLEEALTSLPPAFRSTYERSTTPVPAHLVVEDRLDPERLPGSA